jgi:hypothetical protein
MLNPETLATLGTRNRTLEKTVEGNDKCSIQRHWQHSTVFSNVLCLVPNVASVSGLSIHHCPLRFSITFYVLFLMLPVSLDPPFIIAL